MSKYIGLDVHVKETVACVFDKEANSFSYETVKTTPFSLKRLLGKHPGASATMEISGLTSNLYDELKPCVKDLVVCNASQMSWMWKSGKKNDRIDARKQAVLLSNGQLPVVHMPSRAVREWRALISHRRALLDDCKRVKNRVRSLINARCLRDKGEGTRWTLKNMRWLWSLADPEGGRYLGEEDAERLKEMLKTIEFFREMIKGVTKRLDRIAENHVGVQLLMTIPGIGPRTAEAVVAYADDVHRFARSKEFPAYFGLTPTLDESGSTRRMGHISKRGPSAVRWLIVESAWRVIAHSPAMRGFWMRVMHGQRSRKKIAIVAVARKLLTIMRAMLLTGTVWDERLAASAAPSLA
jgi:transposase